MQDEAPRGSSNCNEELIRRSVAARWCGHPAPAIRCALPCGYNGLQDAREEAMDVSMILRPEELPFPVTDDVRDRINDLLDAMEREDREFIDCYYDELDGSARDLPHENDMWIRRYYLEGGWTKGVS